MSACELGPWFVAGTLSAGQRHEYIFHLATCPECRSELAWLTRFKKRLCDEVSALPPALATTPIPMSETAGITTLDLVARLMSFVPVNLPSLGVRTNTISLHLPTGQVPLGTLTLPELNSKTLDEWFLATAGN